jgi:hypothetical protein
MSELAEKSAMKAWLLPCGVAEFADGLLVRLLGRDAGEESSSFFSKWMRTSEVNT